MSPLIEWASIISWEPLRIDLLVTPNTTNVKPRLEWVVEAWRREVTSGGRIIRYMDILSLRSDCIRILCEGISKQDTNILVKLIEDSVPEVKAIRFGIFERTPAPPTENVLVYVGLTESEMEDGNIIKVEPFVTTRSPVSVAEFWRFQSATRYITTAEREVGKLSFAENSIVGSRDPAEAVDVEVNYVSFEDANAYARWTNARLMTEAEFMAAYLMDRYTYPATDAERLQRELCQRATSLRGGDEWTIDSRTGVPVIRSGPKYVRSENWRLGRNRRIEGSQYFNGVTTFRVVLPSAYHSF